MRRLLFVMGVALLTAVHVRTATAQVRGYREPDCDLKTSHFLVNSGVVYIKGASDQGDPVKRHSLLENAQRNLLDAIRRGQEDNPAVWYFLGRYYVMTNDGEGADTAFQKAEQLAPQCKDDIDFWRRYAWVPVINKAIDSLRNNEFEGAKHFLRIANDLYSEDNLGAFYLGRIFANEGQLDSAIVYFKRVVALGEPDSTNYQNPENFKSRRENYTTSLYNVGLLYSMSNDADSAAVWFRTYRTQDPSDMQALSMLASALDRAGRTDQALIMYDSILAAAPQVAAIDLFKTGEALFNAERYEKAVDAFKLGLAKNQFSRPALYNLANCYLALANADSVSDSAAKVWGQDMEQAARRLVNVDQRNPESLNLLAASYQLQGNSDSVVAVLERRDSLTFQVVVDVQQPQDGSFSVRGRIINPGDAPVDVPEITFEFIDGAGNVISTSTVAPQHLDASATAPFNLGATGEGVVAVRYHAGSA